MDERLVAGVEFQIAGDDLVLKALQDIEDSTRETSERAARAFDEAFDPSKAAAHLAQVEAQVRAKFEAMRQTAEKAGAKVQQAMFADMTGKEWVDDSVEREMAKNSAKYVSQYYDAERQKTQNAIKEADKRLRAEEAAFEAAYQAEKRAAEQAEAAQKAATEARIKQFQREVAAKKAAEEAKAAAAEAAYEREFKALERQEAAEKKTLQDLKHSEAASANKQRNTDELNQRTAKNKALAAAIRSRAEAEQQAEQATRAQAKAAEQAAKADEQYLANLSNTRYALYDVSQTATVIGAAFTAAAIAPVAVSASWEKSFASVARTANLTKGEARDMRDEFERLATEIPESFDSLTQIGTLAGQLDIPKEAVAEFTEVVAKFAATTDVSSEEAAKSIGRLAQLTGTPQTAYENLGSAIYQTGVTAVATESEILAMASSIATSGDLAGLTNVQIVALSSSLASLGIQPEAARGSLQRLFNLIEQGTQGNAKSTANLAKITGMTVDQLNSTWKSGAEGSQQVFSAFVDGLGRIQDSGASTTEMLKDMGVVQVRDQRLLQVLANNTEVYNKALAETASGYSSATALSKGYAQQTDNVMSTLTLLKNALGAILSNLGDSDGVLNGLLKGILSVTNAFVKLTENPIVKFMAQITLGAIALVGVISLMIAGVTRFQGAMFGVVTSMTNMHQSGIRLAGGVRNIFTQVQLATKAINAGSISATEAARTYQNMGNSATVASGKVAALGRTTQAASTQFSALSSRAGVAAAGINVGMGGATSKLNSGLGKATSLFKTFAKGTGWLAAISIGMSVVGKIVDVVGNAFASAEDKAKDFFGGALPTDGLTEALRADAQAVKDGVKPFYEFQAQVERSGKTSTEWADQINTVIGSQVAMADAVDDGTKSVSEQTLAIGENTAKAMANMIASSESFQNVWKDSGDILTSQGFDLAEYFRQVGESADHGEGYINSFLSKAKASLDTTAKAAQDAWLAYERYNNEIGLTPTPDQQARADQLHKQWEETDKVAKSTKTAYDQVATLTGANGALRVSLSEAASGMEISTAMAKAFGESLDETSDDTDEASQKLKEFKESLSALAGDESTFASIQNGIAGISKALIENGPSFDLLSQKGRDNFSALESAYSSMINNFQGDNATLASDITGMMSVLVGSGSYSAEQVGFLQEALTSAFTALNAATGTDWEISFDPSKGIAGMFAAIDAAMKTQKAMLDLQALSAQLDAANAASSAAAGTSTDDYFNQQRIEAQKAYNDAVAKGNAIDAQGKAMKDSIRRSVDEYNNAVTENNRKIKESTDKTNADTAAKKKNREETEKQVITTLDFASSLEQVYSIMDQIAFGESRAARARREVLRDIKGTGEEAKKTSEKVTNFSDLMDKLWAKGERNDALRSVFLEYKKQADEARIAIQKANVTIAGLQNEKANLQYGLQVAIAYGDEERAIRIRQRLAEIEGEIADATRERAEANEVNNRSLVGLGKAEIDNRSTVRSAMGSYQEYLETMYKAYGNTRKFRDALKGTKAEFLAWGKSMGFSEEELKPYLDTLGKFALIDAPEDESKTTQKEIKTRDEKLSVMDKIYNAYQDEILAMVKAGRSQKDIQKKIDEANAALKKQGDAYELSDRTMKPYLESTQSLGTILKNMPAYTKANVVVDVNDTPAKNALRLFDAKNLPKPKVGVDADTNAAKAKIESLKGSLKKPISLKVKTEVESNVTVKGSLSAQLANMLAEQARLVKNPTRSSTYAEFVNSEINRLRKELKSGGGGGMYSGGFTGRGGKYEYAGSVHRGEFVFPKSLVNQNTGLPYLMERANNTTNITNNGLNGNVLMVELSPVDRELLAKAGNVTLVANGKVLGQVVNNANVTAQGRGAM